MKGNRCVIVAEHSALRAGSMSTLSSDWLKTEGTRRPIGREDAGIMAIAVRNSRAMLRLAVATGRGADIGLDDLQRATLPDLRSGGRGNWSARLSVILFLPARAGVLQSFAV